MVAFDWRDSRCCAAQSPAVLAVRRRQRRVPPALFGHPGGGPLRIAPARIAETVNASGTDIYRTGRTSRRVHVLAANLAPGDSGGPLVDQQGRMVGVAFAVDPGQESTAYALTRREVDSVVGPVLAGGGQNAADTGPCLVG